MDPATKDDNVLSFLIDMKIVAKAAEDKKVADGEEFKKRMAFARNRLLMDSLLAQEGKAATNDDAMKKVYEEASKQITGEQEVRARHILVETEDEAKAVKAELDKGADFAELAKKKSKDPGSADGGDLGFFTKEQMVPEFSAVAFALEPGKISDPVKSQFGWHIIKVEEKRNRKAPEFEQVKAPDRAVRHPQGPGRLRRQAARRSQGRADGPAGGRRGEGRQAGRRAKPPMRSRPTARWRRPPRSKNSLSLRVTPRVSNVAMAGHRPAICISRPHQGAPRCPQPSPRSPRRTFPTCP